MCVCLFVFLHSQYGAHLNGFAVSVRVIENYSLSDTSIAGCYLIPASGPWVSFLIHNSMTEALLCRVGSGVSFSDLSKTFEREFVIV